MRAGRGTAPMSDCKALHSTPAIAVQPALAVGIAVLVGVPLGLVAGYRGGWWDRSAMRVAEVMLSIPAIVVAFALVAAAGPGLVPAMCAVGLVFAMRMLRLTRGEVLSAREAEYIDAARVSGSGSRRIIGRHMMPNVLPPIAVQATVLFATAVVLAMALIAEPDLLIADEPTTALDAVVQSEILDLIRGLQEERGLAVLPISHDLGVVAALADRVAIMYAGELVEIASVRQLLTRPRHPYTAGLISSAPRNQRRRGDLPVIPGRVPPPWQWPDGCRFADRCSFATENCHQPSALVPTSTHGMVRCVRASSLELDGVTTEERASQCVPT